MSARVADEPAYVLHHYDWSESSLILEAWSRHHGRLALVAKGAKKPTSQYRPVLLPLQPLRLNWGGDAEVRTLKAAHWQGGHVMPTGESLLSGYYLNELLMRLLARDDPHPALFDHYAQAVAGLASGGGAQQAVLRAFELLLLRELGWLPGLDSEGLTLAPLAPHARYTLVPETGLREAAPEDALALTGAQWTALQAALDEAAPFTAVMRSEPVTQAALRPLLRTLLHYHSGVRIFRTRQMLLDVQALTEPSSSP